MKLSRTWAMPSRWTFTIPPIRKLLDRYVGDGKMWIDPFAGENSHAETTNDINPDRPTTHHLHAMDFVTNLNDGYHKGILFDPPYSLRQVKECYDGIGIKMSFEDSKKFPNNVKDAAANKIIAGGHALSFGWNSGGFGKKRGFEIIEILLVAHGGHHNDTIVTVEKKINHSLSDFLTEQV